MVHRGGLGWFIAGRMNELQVGYARVSTEQLDLAAQRDGLRALGVGDDRILERDTGGKGEGPAPWQQPKLKPEPSGAGGIATRALIIGERQTTYTPGRWPRLPDG